MDKENTINEHLITLRDQLISLSEQYKTKVNEIQQIKWYKRKHVSIISTIILLVFAALYVESIQVNQIPDVVTVNIQALILCLGTIVLISTYLRKGIKKYSDKWEKEQLTRIRELKKSNPDNKLEQTLLIANKLRRKLYMIGIFEMILLGILSIINVIIGTFVISAIQTPTILRLIVVGIILVIAIPFTVNEIIKQTALFKESRKYSKNFDTLHSNSKADFIELLDDSN